jgi:hypothetical protein
MSCFEARDYEDLGPASQRAGRKERVEKGPREWI